MLTQSCVRRLNCVKALCFENKHVFLCSAAAHIFFFSLILLNVTWLCIHVSIFELCLTDYTLRSSWQRPTVLVSFTWQEKLLSQTDKRGGNCIKDRWHLNGAASPHHHGAAAPSWRRWIPCGWVYCHDPRRRSWRLCWPSGGSAWCP